MLFQKFQIVFIKVTEIFSWGVQQTSALETEIVALERITEYSNTPAEVCDNVFFIYSTTKVYFVFKG